MSPMQAGQNRERERAGHGSAMRASDGRYTRSLTLAVLTRDGETFVNACVRAFACRLDPATVQRSA